MTSHRLLPLICESNGEVKEIQFSFAKMFNAGFSARNQKNVRAHILELEKEGIKCHTETPVFFSLSRKNLTLNESIQVTSKKTSGEVEFVFCIDKDSNIYVGIGSDHTDRALEEYSMLCAKEICPNVMANKVWDYNDIIDHWDSIEIESRIKHTLDSPLVTYQKDSLAAIMRPLELIDRIKKHYQLPHLNQSIIFSGTLPVLLKAPVYGEYFECLLKDPILNREISFGYEIEALI